MEFVAARTSHGRGTDRRIAAAVNGQNLPGAAAMPPPQYLEVEQGGHQMPALVRTGHVGGFILHPQAPGPSQG